MKLIKRILKLLFSIAIVYVGLCMLMIHFFIKKDYEVQNYNIPKEDFQKSYNDSDWAYMKDTLMAQFGANKTLPEGYELAALIALSHYPELRNVPIEFVQEESMIPIASRPDLSTIFGDKEEWIYRVIISTKASSPDTEAALLQNLSFNAQVGVLGHELGHTAYYIQQSFWDIVRLGLFYPFPHFRAKFERDNDRRTIDHGLGWQLFSWATEIREADDTDYLDEYYLHPKQIRFFMDQNGNYQ